MTRNPWSARVADTLPTDPQSHQSLNLRGEPSVRNYVATKLLPIAIPWLGIALSLLGLQHADKKKWPALNMNFGDLVDWPVLAITTACAILGIVLYLSLLGLVAKKGEKYRSWYTEDAAQEVVSVVLNMAAGGIYSRMFYDSWTYFAIGWALVVVCYGAWRSFCFSD
ncbi:hypothetical protein [Paraburkholderia sp.]|uniref:hypothetical protein n=1 Tax=Paraburkholderia sp. TaxID=1926495 RepID=UPI003C4D3AF6